MPSLLVEDLMLCRFNSFVSSGLLLCAVNRGKPCYCLVFRQSVFFHEPPNEAVEARTSAGVDNMTWFRRVGSVVSSRFRARLVCSARFKKNSDRLATYMKTPISPQSVKPSSPPRPCRQTLTSR